MSDPLDLTELNAALDLLTTKGEFLNRISRHNAYEFAGAVADVCTAARRYASGTLPPDFPSDEDVEVFQQSCRENPRVWAMLPNAVIRTALQAIADARRTEEEGT